MKNIENKNQIKHNVYVINGLQMYGYELSVFLKILEINNIEDYVGIDEIESLLLIHVLAFEKVLKISIIALDTQITNKKLRKLGHSPQKTLDYLLSIIENNENLMRNINEEIQTENFSTFMDILEVLSTIKRRYDKIELAVGSDDQENSILNDKIDKIIPRHLEKDCRMDKEIIKYLYVNTLIFLYLIELILGEVNNGLQQQSLVSMFDMKYKLTVLNKAPLDRKMELLKYRKKTWEDLLK